MGRPDDKWKPVPEGAPSLEEMVGPEKVAEAKRRIRDVYEHWEGVARGDHPVDYGRIGDTKPDPETLTDSDWDWREPVEPDQTSRPSS
jgi:hypothetical protein